MNLKTMRIPLSTKVVTVAIALSTILGVSTVSTALVLAKNNTDNTMEEMSAVGLKVIENEINLEVADAAEEAEYLAEDAAIITMTVAGNEDGLAKLWADKYLEEHCYITTFKMDGTVTFAVDHNYGTKAHQHANPNSTVSGIIASNGNLTAQAITPLKIDDKTVGYLAYIKDFSNPEVVDSVKAQTDAEVTLFLDDTRYNTTLTINGKRDIGSKAGEKAISTVLRGNTPMSAQVTIEGQNYYTQYAPLTDIEGKTVGMYFAGFSSAATDSLFLEMAFIAIGIGVALVVITAALLTVTTRVIVRNPLAAAATVVKDLRAGELSAPDTTFQFNNDELGDFAAELTEAKHILSEYVADIKTHTSEMSDGDFTSSYTVDYLGDFKQIRTSFEGLTEKMHDLVVGITSSANEVATGAVQMAEGTQSLAEGTTRQATAVDELNSTIVDISKQIEATAKNAQSANKLAGKTSEEIAKQDKAISDMLSAMNIIKDQTDKIAGVIATIEDIAFQTNILALNASIEAARAGEAGKGFAVVADEVRNLAAKSAESANQTKDLINAAVDAVNSGSSLAELTATTMSEVKDISGKTIHLISEISEAATQQSTAVEQVTVGIEQISQVTTQNSATAEQSAASCEELNSMAEQLKTQINTLKV